MHRKHNRISNVAINNITATFNVDWDVEKYRDEHECEEHWQLRKAFMEKWKNDYPEERLVCLARVFANIEFMGCRYPPQVMQEMVKLSFEVGKQYREQRKTKLQRTFVSASDAAQDRAKGVKREGGEIIYEKPKSTKIEFVAQGQTEVVNDDEELDIQEDKDGHYEDNNMEQNGNDNSQDEEEKDTTTNEKRNTDLMDADDYINEMLSQKCLDVREFRENMFNTRFGRMVLLIRPWARKLWNMQTSCQVCGVNLTNGYENGCYSLCINGKLLVNGAGPTKLEARNVAEKLAWERLSQEVISVVIKEQWIPHGDARISVNDVSGKSKSNDVFGTPVENSVAMKMMQMMGWKGGGLGIASQGIEEPIKPNLQMVNRSGLGSSAGNRMLRRSAQNLMQRFLQSDTFDLDLVFSSEFTKNERSMLHQCAQSIGLASRSYGEGDDRFLVVKKKLDPFSLVRAIIEKGGSTPKYQVFIPACLKNMNT